ncbi:MAG: double-cubane-cluster-containing anaerobic reductase [Thermoplasmatota archaeon]
METRSVKEKVQSRYLKDKEGYFSEEQRIRTKKESKNMADRVRENLESQNSRAKTMSYFDEILGYGGVREAELKEFREKGGKVVGKLCVMVPDELIVAAGAKPVRVCTGYYESVHPANELLGDAGLCPLVKSTLGSKMVGSNPLIEQVDMIVGPATCDGKMKMAEILEDWLPVHMMNVPRVKTGDTTTKLWLEEIKYLKRVLEDLTGRKITRRRLLKEIDKWNKAQRAWLELMEMRKSERPLISGQDALVVTQASEIDDIDRWTKKVINLTAELRQMGKKGLYAGEDGAARIMISGSPIVFPNFKIPAVVEESGGLIVTDELCTGFRLLADPVVLDERSSSEAMRAIAERYFYPCTCPCFAPNDERIKRMKEGIRIFGVEGVIFHTLRGCHLNNLEATKIEIELRDMGIPMLKLESEYDEGDIEQVRTRVEAFIEMIKARREAEKKRRKAGGKDK